MSNPIADVTDNFTTGETPDVVATKEVFYTSDGIVLKEGNEDIIYQYGHQGGIIDDLFFKCIKKEEEEQKVDVHLVGEEVLSFEDLDTRLIKHEEDEVLSETIVDEPQFIIKEEEEEKVGVHLVGEEVVYFEDLDTRLIKHEEDELLSKNIVNEPQCIIKEEEEQKVDVHFVGEAVVKFEDLDTIMIKNVENEVLSENIVFEPQEEKEEGFEYTYILQENVGDPLKHQSLKCVTAEDDDCQDDFVGKENAEDSNAWLILDEGDNVPSEFIEYEPQVEDKSIAVPQSKDQARGQIIISESHNVSMMPEDHPHTVGKAVENADTVLNCPDNVQMKRTRYMKNCGYVICSVCKLAFSTNRKLSWHFNASHKRVHICHICQLPFASKSTKDDVVSNKDYPYMCSACPFACQSLNIITKHMSQSHPELSKRKSELCRGHQKRVKTIQPIFPFHCSFCLYKCQSKMDFDKHLKCHAKMKCPVCPKVFLGNQSRIRHIQIFHRNFRLQRCTLCPFICLLSAPLQEHIDEKHSAKKPFKCSKCPYASKYAYALKYHMTTCLLPKECDEYSQFVENILDKSGCEASDDEDDNLHLIIICT